MTSLKAPTMTFYCRVRYGEYQIMRIGDEDEGPIATCDSELWADRILDALNAQQEQ